MRARMLALAALGALMAACTGNPGRDALESLKSGTFSPAYHSGFWAGEADRHTALWQAAHQLCQAQEAAPTPNCRVVLAVDLSARIIAVHQGEEDQGDRLNAWIRGGTRELGLPSAESLPPPAAGFGPEPPRMPAFGGR
jgi:hypothetical protein